jgi:hypothetical protein
MADITVTTKVKMSYKGLTGHWTKYGGYRMSLAANQKARVENWYCQICGREQPSLIPPMKIKIVNLDEYLNACSTCFVHCKPTLSMPYNGGNE